MKLIEVMNELVLSEKKIAQKREFISRYAARPSFREDALGGKEGDRVKEHVQAALDIIEYHEKLKRSLDYTNLIATTEVAGKKYTLHSLIQHKRLLCKLKRSVYQALSDGAAQTDVNQLRTRGAEGKITAQVVYNYDVMEREKKLQELTELESQIDSALQIANAKIDMIEPPK